MYEYSKQLERVKRFLARLENQDKDQTAYEDDLWSFFQHCWHLKDWIKNDDSISKDMMIEEKVKNYKSLQIVADLANRSKHLKLRVRSTRVDADVKSIGVTIYVPTLNINMKTGKTTTSGNLRSEYKYTIMTNEGLEYDALDLARNSVKDWEDLIKELNI